MIATAGGILLALAILWVGFRFGVLLILMVVGGVLWSWIGWNPIWGGLIFGLLYISR